MVHFGDNNFKVVEVIAVTLVKPLDILPENSWDTWIDTTNTDKQSLQHLLTQYPHEEMTAWRAGTGLIAQEIIVQAVYRLTLQNDLGM